MASLEMQKLQRAAFRRCRRNKGNGGLLLRKPDICAQLESRKEGGTAIRDAKDAGQLPGYP
jgi:hypothetical protein